MPKKRVNDPSVEGSVVIRFNLIGLIVFSMSLVLAGGLLTASLGKLTRGGKGTEQKSASAASQADIDLGNAPEPKDVPPWGELMTSEILIERPEEYIGYETSTNKAPTWVFDGMSHEQTRALMATSGLTDSQIERALAPGLASPTATSTIVKPDGELLLSLPPQARGKLYAELGHSASNHYMQFPFRFPQSRVDQWLDDSAVDPQVKATIKTLLYPQGNAECFSDFEMVLRSIPSEEKRLDLVKALSRQPATLVRVHVRPSTDLERLLGYWGRGLQVKDARPLLESLKRLDGGGNISLLYLLPRFARERLYTFPLPPKPGEPPIDCHWSTMNFFNDPPDDRFTNPQYTVQYLNQNYYPVAKPSLYGDIVLILDKQGNAIHSAVYLADDIVFTKNGNNYAQAWMLMRLKDLESDYTSDSAPKLLVYRNKNS